MALTITPVPDSEVALGPSRFNKQFQVQPGLSDYPSGGYPLVGSALGLGNLWGAERENGNIASAAYGVTFVLSTYPTIPAPCPAMFMVVTSSGSQVAGNTNLQSCTWIIEVDAAGE
jgi:hypothetical protein